MLEASRHSAFQCFCEEGLQSAMMHFTQGFFSHLESGHFVERVRLFSLRIHLLWMRCVTGAVFHMT